MPLLLLIYTNRPIVECVWLKAGLQPHPAWVRLIRLWAGWGCTPVVQSNHGTQDKPAITTHTQERATVMAACYICSASNILPSPINGYSQPTTTCVLCRSVSEGPSKSHLCVAANHCYTYHTIFLHFILLLPLVLIILILLLLLIMLILRLLLIIIIINHTTRPPPHHLSLSNDLGEATVASELPVGARGAINTR